MGHHCFLLPLLITLILCFPHGFSCFREYPSSDYLNRPHFTGSHTDYDTKISRFSRFPTRSNRDGGSLSSPKVVSVDDFGAKGDGEDDSEAFNKAWKVACSSQGGVLVVPARRVYNLKPITFSGPCNSDTTMQIHGTIKASTQLSDYEDDRLYWIQFDNIQNLIVQGGGTINGNGKIWWRNSCKIDESRPCTEAPTALTFNECKNLRVEGLRIRNAQQMHVRFQKSVNVDALNLVVTAPGNSPNTDGIHVTESQNIQIKSSVIGTGDDCISIVSGSRNILATDIECGPGHGISIGSLGKGNSEANVSNVLVNRARLFGTTNGVRIKTWQGGKGYARNIKFKNIAMHNVSNPIIIDQNYCDQEKPCQQKGSAVLISNVIYNNIKGTSASETAIKFNCSDSSPCQSILLQNVHLLSTQEGESTASCVNVEAADSGAVFPTCCEGVNHDTSAAAPKIAPPAILIEA